MIRPFSLRDVLLVKQLQGDGVQLDVEGAILKPHAPLMAALALHLPFDDIGASTYVLDAVEGGQRVRGFTQARGRLQALVRTTDSPPDSIASCVSARQPATRSRARP